MQLGPRALRNTVDALCKLAARLVAGRSISYRSRPAVVEGDKAVEQSRERIPCLTGLCRSRPPPACVERHGIGGFIQLGQSMRHPLTWTDLGGTATYLPSAQCSLEPGDPVWHWPGLGARLHFDHTRCTALPRHHERLPCRTRLLPGALKP